MRPNLVIACAGKTSLYQRWIAGTRNFDLMLVEYALADKDYSKDAEYYCFRKGTKFNLVGDVCCDVSDRYEYIFIPDDDLYLEPQQINRLFELAKEYDLQLCQPSLVGYYSLLITLHVPQNILRYTNYVEIMCPCFRRDAFELCKDTFLYNKSCWGIDMLWNKRLGFPKDKIAIIDEVAAVHTRPCFKGDYYTNNDVKDPIKDVYEIVEKEGLSWEKIVYRIVLKEDRYDIPSEQKISPSCALNIHRIIK